MRKSVILIFFTIPILGLILTFSILSSLDSSLHILEIYYNENSYRSNDITLLYEFYLTSIYLLISSLLIVISFYASIYYAGVDRKRNAAIFPKIIPALLIIFSFLLIAQALVAMGILYFFFAYYVEFVPTGFIFIIAIGAFFGLFAFLKALYQLLKKEKLFINGKNLSKKNHKELWEHVYQIADKVGSEKPDNIIVGLEPNFFVTAVKVETFDGQYNGKTLFLSVPLMNLLTMDELDSIIGHELGHFKGDDTEYSIKFSPVYKSLGTSITELENQESVILLPLLMILSEIYLTLDINQSAISRSRELLADEIGVSVSSSESFAIALTKIITFSSFWEVVETENMNRVFKNKISVNLPSVFLDAVKYNLSKKDIDEIKNSALSSSISHPTDTHPILSERINNIGYDYSKINIESIQNVGNSAKTLLTNCEDLELDLTNTYQQFTMHRVSLHQEAYDIDKADNEKEANGFNFLYAMAAALVGADGRIEQEEIAVAEDIGAELYEEFDRVDFRLYVNNLDKIPDFNETAESLKDLELVDKKRIYSYLFEIANADGEFHESEKILLDELSKIWCLS